MTPKIGQDDPKDWAKMAKMTPKIGQDDPKIDQDDPKDWPR